MRRSSTSVFIPNHWNGVKAFGTNPPTLTVTEPLWPCSLASSTQRRASSTMPRVSSSVSVGSPTRKYSFTRFQPWLKAEPTAAWRSSSVMSLLMTWRMRHVPASGANVRPVRRAFWIWAATSTVKASTRRLGRLTEMLPHPSPSSIASRTTSVMPEKSAVERLVSATSS